MRCGKLSVLYKTTAYFVNKFFKVPETTKTIQIQKLFQPIIFNTISQA